MQKKAVFATLALVTLGTWGALIVVTGVPQIVFAHQNGCHRWHSCPPDPGSKKPYICGDTGYCNYCTDNKFCLKKKVRPRARR